ncbi:MAG TPA: flavin reductase family protein [Rhodothermales bacterium]|nr:flavin reductase family protein [Rhodothermales bacterium]
MRIDTQIDGDTLRAVMRRVPSPVVVVTAASHEVRGATIGSFTSVSLNPPLISFNIARDSQMYAVIMAAERFAVHVLTDAHAWLCQHFARPDIESEEQFSSVTYRLHESGMPILEEAPLVLFCRKYAAYPAGDHTIVVGEVEAIEEHGAGRPILYYNRSYRGLGKVVTAALPVATNLESSGRPEAPDPKNA